VRLVALALVALTSVASADTSVAVVVSGDEAISKRTHDVVHGWFQTHGLMVEEIPLPKDGLKTLQNCLVLSDMTCARGVVEKRGRAGNIIGITEQTSGKGAKRSVQLSAYWIAKEHEVVSLQRLCDGCTDAVLSDTLVAMLDDLAKLAPTMGGTIHVTSTPSGMKATVDNDVVGRTPFDRPVSFGPHVISIQRDGRVVAQQKIEMKPAETLDVPLVVPDEPKPKEVTKVRFVEHRGSRTMPVVVLTVGLAAAVTGVVLWETGGPTGDAYTYRNMRPAGIATGISGGVAVLVGGIWLLKGGSKTSRPEVSITDTQTTVGWARSF
jgi:hypothetical protein